MCIDKYSILSLKLLFRFKTFHCSLFFLSVYAYLTTVSCMHYSLVRLIIAVQADYFLLIRPRIRRWLSFGDGRTLIDLADELCTKCVWFTLLLARMWVLKATTSLFLHRTFIIVRTSVVYICDCTLQLSGGERAFLYRWVMPIVNNAYLFFYL